jgi:hypothetical protein
VRRRCCRRGEAEEVMPKRCKNELRAAELWACLHERAFVSLFDGCEDVA